MNVQRLSIIGDTIYAFDEGNFYTLGDGGVMFDQGSKFPFGWKSLSAISQLGTKIFAAVFHSGGGSPQPPVIYYSTDNSVTYNVSSFTNAVSFGYDGLGGDFVEQFLETPSTLIADMNAGYAISTDGGLNWTFSGGQWDRSFLAVDGTYLSLSSYSSNPICKSSNRNFNR